jgi:cytochrome c-type biogenesis protein CcmE
MPDEEAKSEAMADEGADQGAGQGADEGKLSRRYSSKQVRIALLVIVVAVIAVILLWGMVPDPIYEVGSVLEDIDDLNGQYINVKGTVISWESGHSNYTLADSNDENLTLQVTHSGAFPEGFGMEATIVAKGIVKKGSSVVRMDSDEIQIGCPSKY